MEDTTPKFLESVTEHPDVQRLCKQIIRSDIKNKELQAENAKLQAEIKSLKNQLLTPCVTCNAFIENAKLKDAIQAIIDHEEARKKCGCGYDLFVHDTAVVAIVF